MLPAGRDFSLAAEDPFASEQEQFLEPFETPAPVRSAEIATPKLEVTEESRTTPTQAPKSVLSAVPKTRPPHEPLSSGAPFTVSVPRTLRPVSTENVQPAAPTEPPRERPRVQASITREEPAPIVHSTDLDVKEFKQAITSEADAITPTVTDPIEEHQAPIPRLVHTEVSAPVPRVDRVDGPSRQTVAEPSPPSALPVHVPPATGSTARQEQSRITIGSLEVLVNNHPKALTPRPAPPPSRGESLNLEKRYLDRFRLRH